MLYTSPWFPVFLLSAAFVFHASPKRLRPYVLLAASLAYYLTWSIQHLGLLVVAACGAHRCATSIADSQDEARKRKLMIVGVVALTCVLAVFKYSVVGLTSAGVHLDASTLAGLAAPVGISYYTFKLISYVVDVYWEKTQPFANAAEAVRYAAFFPQVLSGPIQRSGDFAAQVETPRADPVTMITAGLRMILFGLFKKLVVADRIGVLVDQVHRAPSAYSNVALCLAAYLYAVQLYADFSGLSDIALGIGSLFGVMGPRNFDNPYYAQNIQDFWRRWHMSLTTWLGDYVFMPLRMATRDWGQVGLAVSIAVNMLLIGLWHGPRLTFLVFGLISAAYMVGSALTLKARNKLFARRPRWAAARRIWSPILVFHMMVLAFIPFRSATLEDAFFVSRGFFLGLAELPASALSWARGAPVALGPFDDWSMQHTLALPLCVALMELGHWLQGRELSLSELDRTKRWIRWSIYYVLIALILFFGRSGSQSFIYFNF